MNKSRAYLLVVVWGGAQSMCKHSQSPVFFSNSDLFLGCDQGKEVQVKRLLDLHRMLKDSDTHLRQPINLEQQLLQSVGSDCEVALSMVQMLQV